MGKLTDILKDVGAEARRMGTLGAAELAAALFRGGDAFVQYGDGQRVQHGHSQEEEQKEKEKEKQKEMEQQGWEMGM